MLRVGKCDSVETVAHALTTVRRMPYSRALVLALCARFRGRWVLATVHSELAELWIEKLYSSGLIATVERA